MFDLLKTRYPGLDPYVCELIAAQENTIDDACCVAGYLDKHLGSIASCVSAALSQYELSQIGFQNHGDGDGSIEVVEHQWYWPLCIKSIGNFGFSPVDYVEGYFEYDVDVFDSPIVAICGLISPIPMDSKFFLSLSPPIQHKVYEGAYRSRLNLCGDFVSPLTSVRWNKRPDPSNLTM